MERGRDRKVLPNTESCSIPPWTVTKGGQINGGGEAGFHSLSAFQHFLFDLFLTYGYLAASFFSRDTTIAIFPHHLSSRRCSFWPVCLVLRTAVLREAKMKKKMGSIKEST